MVLGWVTNPWTTWRRESLNMRMAIYCSELYFRNLQNLQTMTCHTQFANWKIIQRFFFISFNFYSETQRLFTKLEFDQQNMQLFLLPFCQPQPNHHNHNNNNNNNACCATISSKPQWRFLGLRWQTSLEGLEKWFGKTSIAWQFFCDLFRMVNMTLVKGEVTFKYRH